MKKMRMLMLFGMAVLTGATSCSLLRAPKAEPNMQASCVIETEAADVLVEVRLDRNLIFSGKTKSEKTVSTERFVFTAAPGEHQLTISAGGYEEWVRQVTVAGGSCRFWAKLKKLPVSP